MSPGQDAARSVAVKGRRAERIGEGLHAAGAAGANP
jgi:hypothetical protein